MSLLTEWVRYGGDGAYLGYLARPARAQAHVPGVIVVQEIWGVDGHIQDVARRIAQAGYVALAPDLYAVNGARPTAVAADRVERVKAFLNGLPPGAWGDAAQRDAALAKLPPAEAAAVSEAFGALFGGLRSADHTPHLLAGVSYLRREQPASRGEGVASVGFCMGGALSALLACRDPELRGAAIFYGSAPPEDLLPRIQCPLIGFYGALDARITEAAGPFAEALRRAGKSFESHVYEGAHHAFFNDTRASYHIGAARDSFSRLLAFLVRTLG